MTNPAMLESIETLAILEDSELFEGVDADTLRDLATHARVVEFATGDRVFQENDLAENVYLIVSGRVSLVICRPHVGCRQLLELGEGELLGWSSLLDRNRFSATAEVRTATKMVELCGKHLTQLCGDNPSFFGKFMSRVAQIVAQRLNATRLQLLELSGIHLPLVTIESD